MLQTPRVLAVDPTSRGFGYAVMESPGELIDWGVKEIRETGQKKNDQCLDQIRDLLVRYRPSVILLEDCKAELSRRSSRVRDLAEDILKLAGENKLRTCLLSRSLIKKTFSPLGAATQHEIARRIAQSMPELAGRLPPPRKPWMGEDSRLSIFNAVSFALAYYYMLNQR